MIVELGHFALVLALAVAMYQTLVPLYGAHTNNPRLMALAAPAAAVQFLLVSLAFAALIHAYVTSDFSVLNVWQNSHTAKPFIYKITGTWANHEGSMLLWVFILSLFTLAVAAFSGNLPLSLKARVLGVQGAIATAFLFYIVTVSSPFVRIPEGRVPLEGRGMNPLLQDPALAAHPPMLYAGYVGFSVAFAFAIAALLEGKVDSAWARWVRPWTLAAWTFLTAGIALGAFWAYYELGWGGWWFWDPVENASFMPWLAGTALLHSAIVVEKRNALKTWTILLALVAFSFSLIGTFLVRSGVLSSVHAFAVDPERGTFILAILAFFIGGSLFLYAVRAHVLKMEGSFDPVSREGALVLNNVLLSAATAAVFIGTIFPLVYEAVTGGGKITVGAPYFNMTFGALIFPLLVLLPVGPLLAWKRGNLKVALKRLKLAALAAALVALAMALWLGASIKAALGIAVGAWVFFGAWEEWAGRVMLFRAPLRVVVNRIRTMPGHLWAMTLAHAGVGLVVLGAIISSTWKGEVITAMQPGQKVHIAGYEVLYKGMRRATGPNYLAEQGLFEIFRDGRRIAEEISEKRTFLGRRGMPTTEVALLHRPLGDLYIAIGDRSKMGRTVRVYFQPMIYFLWLGALMMVFGGFVGLLDRRFRVGVAERTESALAAQPAE